MQSTATDRAGPRRRSKESGRTGRGGLRNGLTRLYFEALGFETLRHAGTADHLHVAMPPRATAPPAL